MSEISQLHAKLWKRGYGSVSAAEAEFITAGIARDKPKLFVEIGTATGLSTVMIAVAMQNTGSGHLVTLDHSETFFGDPSKRNGFVIDEHFGETPPSITRLTGCTSLDLASKVSDPIDMAFIDANHAHPWPTIDTLMIWPLLKDGATLFLHDIRNYQRHPDRRGIGPKYLFDCLPDSCKTTISDTGRNLARIKKSIDSPDFASRMYDSLMMPWEKAGHVTLDRARFILDYLARHYPPILSSAFTSGIDSQAP